MLQRFELPPPMTTVTARTRRWTYADYCRIPPDRKRHEIIDGRHFVNPAPSPYHQIVAGRLFYELMRLVEKPGRGRVLSSPIDVHLAPGTVVQPDIVVLRPRNASIIGPKKLTGVPDLLVEVLSPSNRGYDRRIKRDRYERAGVRELWLVDPEHHSVEQLVLDRNRRYRAPVTAAGAASVSLRVLREVTIDLAEVW
jgi:Uma2 family endonuclease